MVPRKLVKMQDERCRQLQRRLGGRVRALRKRRGLSQEGFAAEVDIHRVVMGRIERGEVNLGLCTLDRLAQGLEISIAVLMEGVEEHGVQATKA